MRPDAYTKTILTVIALCLLWICARDFIPATTAIAQQNAQPVIITGVGGNLALSGLPVKLDLSKGNKLPVSLEKIDIEFETTVGRAFTDERITVKGKRNTIPISLEKISLSSSGQDSKIPVSVEKVNLDVLKDSSGRAISIPVALKDIDLSEASQRFRYGDPPVMPVSIKEVNLRQQPPTYNFGVQWSPYELPITGTVTVKK